METTMKLAIETYAELTNRTFQDVVNECNSGNKTIIESVMMLMFSIS